MKILFVCLGNICRSPMAEAVFNKQVADAGLEDRLQSDSAGTAGYHEGRGADPRTLATLDAHGIPHNHTARRIRGTDFEEFDLILAMDSDNLRDIQSIAGANRAKVRRFRDFDPKGSGDVPDPYYGDADGFETVYAMCERTCQGLLNSLKQ